jgi:urease accessory protein
MRAAARGMSMATTPVVTNTAMSTLPTITRSTRRTIMRMVIRTTTVIIIMMMRIAITSITPTAVIPMLMTTNRPEPAEAGIELAEGEAAALYRLMTWLSPAFPVGAFSYSSGIEWAVEAGDIVEAASFGDWLTAMLADGSGFCDGVFLCHAYRAVEAGEGRALRDVAELAAAFVPSRERQLETSTQGRAFIETARVAWSCDGLDQAIACCEAPIVYPVAVGIVGAAHAIPLAPTLHAFLHAVVSNWISAGSRLIPLGQTDCQRLLAMLEPVVAATADRALAATLDDLGSATFRADLASLRHETQYTRLFRS